MTTRRMMDLMGAETTESEANAMIAILSERGLDAERMSDAEFFSLIPDAIARVRGEG